MHGGLDKAAHQKSRPSQTTVYPASKATKDEELTKRGEGDLGLDTPCRTENEFKHRQQGNAVKCQGVGTTNLIALKFIVSKPILDAAEACASTFIMVSTPHALAAQILPYVLW